MNEKNELKKKFECKICIKNYSSHSSLCNHNKKFHNNKSTNNVTISNNNVTISNDNVTISNDIVTSNNDNVTNNNNIIFKCLSCNKKFNNRQTKWCHQKICNNNKTIDEKSEIIEIKKEYIEIKKENIEIKNILKELLEKNCKIHPKTLQKINKQLINNNTNTTNNGIINNGPVINNTYVKFGNEKLSNLLTHKDMLKIINKQCLCIEESIKSVHFNKNLPEYNNVFITNMRDSIAYIFDGSKFILTSKEEVINELFNTHLENIEQFLEDAEIAENKYTKITKFLEVLNDNEQHFIDGNNNNKKYSNYKAYKLIAIKQLIYNESDQKSIKKLNNMKLQEKININN